jgi:hypothetical protein
MNANEFVTCWKNEKDTLFSTYMDETNETDVATKIASLDLTPDQRRIMRGVVDGILTDVFYSLLLGLDGAANIGGIQQTYQVQDEDGGLICGSGELEAEACEQFHEDTT